MVSTLGRHSALWLMVVLHACLGAPGDLDPSFGTGGKVITDFGIATSIAVQSDGRIVVAGYTGGPGHYDFALARYNADGTLDSSFGSAGKVTTDFGGGSDFGRSVALQSDGKIVVAGESANGSNYEFALARYNGDGALDDSFGSGGKVTTAIGLGNAVGYSVALQEDGKILVAGYSHDASAYTDFALARYNDDGTLDDSFGSGGKVNTAIGTFEEAYSLAVQDDGKIVVAGFSVVSTFDFGLVRYNENGTLDGSFGSGGKVTTDVGGDSDYARSVAVQSDGKIVVAGYSDGSNYDFALTRYNEDGTLDGSFGNGGKVTTDLDGTDDYSLSVALQDDGKIVVAGYSEGSSVDFALARYDEDGTLDASFGSGGKVTTDFPRDFGSRQDYGTSVTLQSDGKIAVCGGSYNGGFQGFAMARYQGLPTPGTITTPATSVQSTTALVHATVNPEGNATTAHFEYDTDPGLTGAATTSDTNLGSGTTDVPVDATLNSLAPGTTYYFRVVATNAFGVSKGTIRSFTTLGGTPGFSPAVQTLDATAVGNGSAILQAMVLPNGQATTGYCEYGTDPMLADATETPEVGLGGGVASVPLGQLVNGLAEATTYYFRAVATNGSGTSRGSILNFTTAALVAITKTTGVVPGEPGSQFLVLGAPAVDQGQIGGAATITTSGRQKQTIIYGGDTGEILARTGGPSTDDGVFTALGDPVFGGDAFGFAGISRTVPAAGLPMFPRSVDLMRLAAPRPGKPLAGLYSRLSRAAGLKRVAVQAGLAPGTSGRFAKLPAFALPRDRAGLIFTGKLQRGGAITKRNDAGIWRETAQGGESQLLIQQGDKAGTHVVTKLELMIPVENASDQRRSIAPDGGVATAARFDDGTMGVVRVAPDGAIDVPVDQGTAVPGLPGAVFEKISAPATRSGGAFAFFARMLRKIGGVTPKTNHAVFSSFGGTFTRVLQRGDPLPGDPEARMTRLGQPLLGQGGMIGLIAALSGRKVPPNTRKAILRHVDGGTSVVARLGEQVAGGERGVRYRRFQSMVVTDTPQGQILFTGTMAGPGVTARNHQGLWCVPASGEAKLLLRSDQVVNVGNQMPRIRVFQALQAPRGSTGQGRTTDATGFATAKVKLSDGRTGVLRIPLP